MHRSALIQQRRRDHIYRQDCAGHSENTRKISMNPFDMQMVRRVFCRRSEEGRGERRCTSGGHSTSLSTVVAVVSLYYVAYELFVWISVMLSSERKTIQHTSYYVVTISSPFILLEAEAGGR